MTATSPAPPVASAGGARSASPGSVGAAGLLIVLTAFLSWFTWDQLQNRLQQSSARFEAATQRVERHGTLHDAAVEATLALERDLSAPPDGADAGALAADVARFAGSTTALGREMTQSGMLTPSQAASFDDAVRQLRAALAAPPASAAADPARRAVRQVLARLAADSQVARQREALAAGFLAEVDDVRRRALLAFAGLVLVLALVVGVAARWAIVARRERLIRGEAQRLAEVADAERARAENVARDKARFLGMLSHELLTPLQSIWSTMDLIEARGRVEAHEPAFTRLKDSTRSLRARISDLVDFARMSSGRLQTRVRGFQLDKLIDGALRDVEESLAAKNLDVHWEAGPELSERVFSDPARLRQIVDNLLTNAVKYTERGGISIHAELDRAGGVLRVEIADTGVGIEPSLVQRLFEPFYRAPATAAMAEGSGLGLAVVHSLLELMGGSIRVNSQVGQGTTIVVEVPIAESGEAEADDASRLDTGQPVLVVDDSREARRALCEVLRELGFDVYEADGGVAGLAEAERRDYLAIVLDLQMPDLAGDAVARRLRTPGGRHANTFLVLVSAFEDLADASLAGLFDARVDKPASRHDLALALGRAARVRR